MSFKIITILSNIIKKIWQYAEKIAVIVGVICGLFTLSNMATQTKTQTEALQEQVVAMQNSRSIESARFILEMNRDINDKRFDKIAHAILGGYDDKLHDSNFKILKESGGNFTRGELEAYLDIYSDIASILYEENLVDEDTIYSEYAYSVEKISCNKDVQKFIVSIRNGDSSDDAYYSAIDDLVEAFRERHNFTCEALDKQ